MPDENGVFKGIVVPAGAWERVFGKGRVTLGEVRDLIKSGMANLEPGPEPEPPHTRVERLVEEDREILDGLA